MPGLDAASRYGDLRRDEAVSPKVLHAIDASSAPDSPVHNLELLTACARAAVDAGGGHVLDAAHVIFPNGGITLVLILAESHLSVHTWPEEQLVAIDLFSCGAIDGGLVIDQLVSQLKLKNVTVRQLPRGLA
jgi:S-adenosylmethionine decarboxylase proenzyme